MAGPAGADAPKPGRLTSVSRRPRPSDPITGSKTVRSVRSEWSSTRSRPRPTWTTSRSVPPSARMITRRSAEAAGRELARVHRLLQELLGVVLPELADGRSEEHTSELQSPPDLVC